MPLPSPFSLKVVGMGVGAALLGGSSVLLHKAGPTAPPHSAPFHRPPPTLPPRPLPFNKQLGWILTLLLFSLTTRAWGGKKETALSTYCVLGT